MSLDFSLYRKQPTEIFWANVTHNLNRMADAAGIYKCLWRPEEVGITRASEMIAPLKEGLENLKANPDKYRQYDAENGWGKYDDFVPWIERLLAACEENPDAEVRVSR